MQSKNQMPQDTSKFSGKNSTDPSDGAILPVSSGPLQRRPRFALAAINARYSHTSLAIRLLRQACLCHQQKDYELILFEQTINDPYLSLLRKLVEMDASVYAFSCYIWNRKLIDSLCRDLKMICPDCLILVGGPEAGSQAQAFLSSNSAVDIVLAGEGEGTLPVVLDLLSAGKTVKDACSALQGVFCLDADGHICGSCETDMLHPDDWPFAYEKRELNELKERILYYESSRGCPFGCTYCLSARDRKVRFRSLARVFSELEAMVDAGVRLVKFVDRTFNCDPARARRIWLWLMEKYQRKPYRTRFHFEITAELLEASCLELLARSPVNLFQFEIGVQSCQTDILATIDRPGQPEKMARAVQVLQQNGAIHLHLDLIAGLPGETLQQFSSSFDFVIGLYPDLLQLGFLKILPGSLMQEQARERHMGWQVDPPYEVFRSDAMSFQELSLLKRLEHQLDHYYNSGQYRLTIRWLMAQEPSAFCLFRDLALYYCKQGWENRQISRQDRWQFLKDFLAVRRPSYDAGIMRDCMIMDYLACGQRDIPAWQQSIIASDAVEDQRILISGKERMRSRFPKIHRYRLELFHLPPARYMQMADQNRRPPFDSAAARSGSTLWLAAFDLSGEKPVLLWQEEQI